MITFLFTSLLFIAFLFFSLNFSLTLFIVSIINFIFLFTRAAFLSLSSSSSSSSSSFPSKSIFHFLTMPLFFSLSIAIPALLILGAFTKDGNAVFTGGEDGTVRYGLRKFFQSRKWAEIKKSPCFFTDVRVISSLSELMSITSLLVLYSVIASDPLSSSLLFFLNRLTMLSASSQLPYPKLLFFINFISSIPILLSFLDFPHTFLSSFFLSSFLFSFLFSFPSLFLSFFLYFYISYFLYFHCFVDLLPSFL